MGKMVCKPFFNFSVLRLGAFHRRAQAPSPARERQGP
jgi:hypothetical protein